MVLKRRSPPPQTNGSASSWDYTIHAPHFTAGFDVQAKRVVRAAPQIHSFVGQRLDYVQGQCVRNNWTLESNKE